MTEKTKDTHSVGVWKKIRMQINYFNSKGIRVKLKDINKTKNTIIDKILKRVPYLGAYNWSISINSIKNANCVYIRYPKSDYQLIKSLEKIRMYNPNIKIIIEIPTYPYEGEEKWSLFSAPIILKDRWNRRKLYKNVDYILTYSDDETIFKTPTIRLSNAIDANNITAKQVTEVNEGIDVIAVANFSFWHGYDRFINGMNEYYKASKGNTIQIKLHLVGEGREIIKLRELVEKYNLQDYVIFYGKRDGIELDEVYNKCEIGLDAMGVHRKSVYYSSTLKGKEYGAKGLPVVSGVKTEYDYLKNYKYYYRVPADESYVQMDDIIRFYTDTYNSNHSKQEIIYTIRKFTLENYDVRVVWDKVADYIKNTL